MVIVQGKEHVKLRFRYEAKIIKIELSGDLFFISEIETKLSIATPRSRKKINFEPGC